jgi:hypothetical protein
MKRAETQKRPTRRATIRLDDATLAALHETADRETRPMANMVVVLIKEALAAREKREKVA